MITASVFIARVAAILYLCVGIGALLDKNSLKRIVEDLIKSPSAAYIGSMFALIMGFCLLAVNSAWNWHWTVIITILGWGGIIKGAFGLMFPDYTLKLAGYFSKMKNLYLIAGPLCIILGLVFGYYGFLA
jgi:hypothetical protein